MAVKSGVAPDTLMYSIADTLQVELTFNTLQTCSGEAIRKVNVGPFSIPLHLRARSALMRQDLATVLAHVKKDLWLLVVSDKDGHRLRLVILDGPKAGLKTTMDHIGTTLSQVNKAVAAGRVKSLEYDRTTHKWSPIDAFDLE